MSAIGVAVAFVIIALGGFLLAIGVRRLLRSEQALRASESRFRLMVSGIKDYAIFMLDTEGRVVSWNQGAARMKGYRSEEILGRHFSCFYRSEDARSGLPEHLLATAIARGSTSHEGWRLRKDGSQFWASVLITAIRDESGNLQGFAKLTRDVTERLEAEAALAREREERENVQRKFSARLRRWM